MEKETLQAISKKANEINKSNGWGVMKNYKRFMALTISELSEMLEADRKDRWSRNIIMDCIKDSTDSLYSMTLSEAHNYISDSKVFKNWFELTVKDTVEDELADVVIRIVSCLASLELPIEDEDRGLFPATRERMKEQTVAENVYDLTKLLMDCDVREFQNRSTIIRLCNIAYLCIDYANSLGIDLVWHINAKLKYNETRSYHHGGKKY